MCRVVLVSTMLNSKDLVPNRDPKVTQSNSFCSKLIASGSLSCVQNINCSNISKLTRCTRVKPNERQIILNKMRCFLSALVIDVPSGFGLYYAKLEIFGAKPCSEGDPEANNFEQNELICVRLGDRCAEWFWSLLC